MSHRKYPSYPDDADYTTNAPSYYEDLARKQGLFKELAERIWGYEATLNASLEDIAKRFIEWDDKIGGFDGDVNELLQEWISDGTFDNIINDTILSWKANQSDLDITNLKQDDLSAELLNNQFKDADLQTQINNLILGAVGSGNNAEVIQAKGYFPTLSERFSSNEEKINSLNTAVEDGIAQYAYSGSGVTNTDIVAATVATTSNITAYTNGFVAPSDISVTKIKLNANTTTTSFNLYSFDLNNVLVQALHIPTPVITDSSFTLTESLFIPKGGRLYVRFNNATYYHFRLATNDLMEYRATSVPPVLAASPIRAGFDIYYTFRTVKFTGNDDIYESLVSAIDVGLADVSTYGDSESTKYWVHDFTASLANAATAYNNGFIAPYSLALKQVKLRVHATPTTSIGLYVFDSVNQLISQTVGVPVVGGIATLPTPLFIKKGYTVFVRFENGSFYYINSGTSNKKEMPISTLTPSTSPIVASFNLVYSKVAFDFNATVGSVIQLDDYVLPNYEEASGKYGLVGRWFKKDVDGLSHDVTLNQGSEAHFKTDGATTISVIWTNKNVQSVPYFAYRIDDNVFVRQLITNPTITLPDNKEHLIRIVTDGMSEGEGKWTNEMGFYLKDITVDTGIIKGILPTNREGLWSGDSITEGINALGIGANSSVNSAINSFPFFASEKLNAISHRVGFGGSAITGAGSFANAITAIDNLSSTRKTGVYTPDFIVLNHGHNDINATSQDFINGYNALLNRFKIKYSGVPVICVIPFSQTKATEIRQCVADKSWCYLVETVGWNPEKTDSSHPSVNGAISIGDKLAPKIEEILGKTFFMN